MNEVREANDEEGVGESNNDGDDTLELKEGLTHSLLERQSDVDGTTIVGKESGRLPPHTNIDWTPPPVRTNIGEPEFNTVDNPDQWIEFTFLPVFEK